MQKNHFKHERTFVMVKPDGVQRSLVGEIVNRFEKAGLKLVALKMLVPDSETAKEHYDMHPEWRKSVGEKIIKGYEKQGKEPPSKDPEEAGGVVLERLTKYISSGPVVAMVLEGAHAVELVRKLVGDTEPLSSDVGTIRGDYVMDSYKMADSDERSVRNIIHASGSTEEAEKEISHWFKENELINYRNIQEKILYEDMDDLLE